MRFEEVDEGFEASLDGPAESLGLDIAAERFAFLRRGRGAWAGGGRGSASGIVFCRLVLLEEGGFTSSDSGVGVGSRAGALRFRDGGAGRVDGAGAGAGAAEVPAEDSEELAALADARVIRGLLAEVMEKGLNGSLSRSADRDGAFPFCAAIDSRHEPILRLSHGQVAVGIGRLEVGLSRGW